MSADKELTGIERELVLRYLRDDNVPLTITLQEKLEARVEDEKVNPGDEERLPPSALFPVAIPSEQRTVLDEGIILLKKGIRPIEPFLGKNVRVQFYFNHLGLYFTTVMKEYSKGLAIVVPSKIFRISENAEKTRYNFSGHISYKSEDGKDIDVTCLPLPGYPLLTIPKWGDLEYEKQHEAKNLLEEIVNRSRRGEGASIGNGIFLLSVVRYLTEDKNSFSEAIEGRAKPFEIIYMDDRRFVISSRDKKLMLVKDGIYSSFWKFDLAGNSLVKRNVSASFHVDDQYENPGKECFCWNCSFLDLKAEDKRFIYEKMYGKKLDQQF